MNDMEGVQQEMILDDQVDPEIQMDPPLQMDPAGIEELALAVILELEENRRKMRNNFEELNQKLRAGFIDSALESCFHSFRGFGLNDSLGPILDEFLSDVGEEVLKNPGEDSTMGGRPSKIIMESLGKFGWEDQLYVYCSRFPSTDLGGMARACEFLQVIPLQSEIYRFILFEAEGGFLPGDELNFFRMSQRIRNEFGTKRKNSPKGCFLSFEDIVKLEREIEEGDAMNLLLQCIKLKLVDWRHYDYMYSSISSFEQLELLHEALTWIGIESPDRYAFNYGERFVHLATRPGSKPTWPQVRKALELTDVVDLRNGIIYGAEIPDGELNETLRFILDRFLQLRLALHDIGVTLAVVNLLKLLLEKGASLYFHDEDKREYTLEALIDYADAAPFRFPLEEFAPYICCPLASATSSVSYDLRQVPSLTCLAARRIPAIKHDIKLPRGFPRFIDVHRTIKYRFDGMNPSSTHDIEMPSFAIDLPFPGGVNGPPRQRFQSMTVLRVDVAPNVPLQP